MFVIPKVLDQHHRIFNALVLPAVIHLGYPETLSTLEGSSSVAQSWLEYSLQIHCCHCWIEAWVSVIVVSKVVVPKQYII